MANKNKMLIISILCGIIGFSCVSKDSDKPINTDKKQDTFVVDNKIYYSKIDSFVNIYDRKRLIDIGNKQIPYSIEDSLCFYFAKLDKKELLTDSEFKYIAGKLLEKQYLEVRKITSKPENFAIYNTSILYRYKKSSAFSLKIVIGEAFNIDSVFDVYAHPWRDFLCIDSVIVTLDKIPQMQNDPNHLKCMNLVKNNKTGGCKW